MIDYGKLRHLNPQTFNVKSKFTSSTCKTSPIASRNKLLKKKILPTDKKFLLLNHKKKIIGEEIIKNLHCAMSSEQKKLRNLKELSVIHEKKIDFIFEKAALMIQKSSRSWIERHKSENLFIEFHQKISEKMIQDLEEDLKKKFYSGKLPRIAAVMIQSVYRGWLFRKKQEEKILLQKVREKRLRNVLQVLSCIELIHTRASILRQARLLKIRENLAILVINKAIFSIKSASKGRLKPKAKVSPRTGSLRLPISPIDPIRRPLKDYTIPESISDSESDNTSSVLTSRPVSQNKDKIRLSKIVYGIRQKSLLQKIPILVESRRNSQIWTSKIDEKSNEPVISLKNSELPTKAHSRVSSRKHIKVHRYSVSAALNYSIDFLG